MGSLLPSWDSDYPGHAPAGYEDQDEAEPQGYFANYSKQKSLRRTSLDPEQASSPRHGPAAPVDIGGASLKRLSSGRPGDELRRLSSGSGRQMQRMSSLPNDFDIVMSPTSASPKVKAVDAFGSAPRDQGFKWWQQMPTSVLNEPPEQPPKKGGDKDRAAHYKPQHDVTGQAFNTVHVEDAGGPAVIPAH